MRCLFLYGYQGALYTFFVFYKCTFLKDLYCNGEITIRNLGSIDFNIVNLYHVFFLVIITFIEKVDV